MKTSTKLYVLFLAGLLLGCGGLLLVSMKLGDSPQLITSDGKAYYAWARSIVLDNDINFSNDYALAYPPDPLPPEATEIIPAGYAVNKYPVGLAILETPGLLVGHLVALPFPTISANGLSVPYQLGVTFSLLIFAVIGLFCLHRTMLLMGSKPIAATVFSIASVLCTNLIHYLGKEPAMPHAAGTAVVCLIVHEICRYGKRQQPITMYRAFFWGALLGFLLLIRNSNVFVLPFIGALLWNQKLLCYKSISSLGIGLTVVALLQPVALYTLWGEFPLTTYPNEGFFSDSGGILKTLFSNRHGLFIYHPWYGILIALTALGVKKPELRLVSASALASFLILLIINGSWHCWWFGDSFGNRAFIEVLPLLSLSACLVFSQTQARAKVLVSVIFLTFIFSVVNLYIWAGYLLHRYPHDGAHSIVEVYRWPTTGRGLN